MTFCRALFGFLLLAQIGCAVEIADFEIDAEPMGIVQGDRDAGDRAVVGVLVDSTSLCTGTLISARVVLTAAHCIEGAKELYVHFGVETDPANVIENPGFKRVDRWIVHPAFDGDTTHGNDFALILLRDPPPPDVAPIPYNGRSLWPELTGEPVRLVGVGVTKYGEQDYGTRRQATATLDLMQLQSITVGGNNGSMCEGDSGAPMLMALPYEETVIAVASYTTVVPDGLGDPCEGETYGGRVDVVAHDFIDPWIDEHDVPLCAADGRCATDCALQDVDCGGFAADCAAVDCGDAGTTLAGGMGSNAQCATIMSASGSAVFCLMLMQVGVLVAFRRSRFR